MGLIPFLVFCAQLVIASSLQEFQENELLHKERGLKLDIFHVRTHDFSPKYTSSSVFSDMILKDDERVRGLHSLLSEAVRLNITREESSITSGNIRSSDLVSIPLKPGLSIGTGNYYVKIGLGTPAKYFTMVMDTGSSFSWLQCQPCVVYCHSQVDQIFDPTTSNTFKRLSCATSACSSLTEATLNNPLCGSSSGECIYRASYGDSSFSIGYLSQDLLSITPSVTLQNFVYGCGQNNQGLFGKTSGILGLANHKLSLIGQLSKYYGQAFSYCLPSSASSREGFLSIGTSSLSSSPSYKFTPIIKNSNDPSFYLIDLAKITVSGKPLQVSASSYKVPTIIDSGTVITRLPMSVYMALRQAFVSAISNKYARASGISILDTCFKGSVKEFAMVPEIKLVFRRGASLALKAHNILIEADKGVSCLAFAGISGTNQIAIIGNHQQLTFNVAFDVANSRIGFSVGGCD